MPEPFEPKEPEDPPLDIPSVASIFGGAFAGAVDQLLIEENRREARRRLEELTPLDLDTCHATAAVEPSPELAEESGADRYRDLWSSEAAVLTAVGEKADVRSCFFCRSDQHQAVQR